MYRLTLVPLLILVASLFSLHPEAVPDIMAQQQQACSGVAGARCVFIQNLTTNSVEFRWKTTGNTSGVIVNYGTSPTYGSQVTADSPTHAKITGLTAGTKYYYQLVAGSTAITAAGESNYYFKTAPPNGSSTPVSFAVLGDPGNGGNSQKSVANQVNNKNPDAVLIAGDVVYNYSADPEYNDARLFDIYANTIRHAPLYATCGNHDSSQCSTLMADQSLPQGGNATTLSSFSWDYGNVHFTVLNSNSVTTTQAAWMENDLRSSSQPWKVVVWHHNGWSAGSHTTNQNIVDLLVAKAAAAGADAIFWGHSHVYERWNRKPGFYPEAQIFTIGNSGQKNNSSCTPTAPGPGCAAKSAGEAGFLFAQVNGNQMTISYITESGSTTDSISLTTSGGSFTPPPPTNTPPFIASPTPIPPSVSTPPTNLNCRGNPARLSCFEAWRSAFTTGTYSTDADMDGNGSVSLADFEVWRRAYTGGSVSPSTTNNPQPTTTNPTPTLPSPQAGDLDIMVCDPSRGPFSTTITNSYMPFPVGMVHVVEKTGFKVKVSVLNQTEIVAGVKTRVVEEREWKNGALIEISRNFFVQAPNGTVCYFGEDVDIYQNGVITGHSGAWRAGVGANKPGIIMPANPQVGQTYQQEIAPGVAMDRAEHISMNGSLTTPAGTFNNVLVVKETPPSDKQYAPGVGMIYDDGMLLTQK